MKKICCFLVSFLVLVPIFAYAKTPREELSSAILAGNLVLVKHYIESGEVEIDELKTSSDKVSPLIEAAEMGRVSLFPYLIEMGAYVEGVSSDNSKSALTELIKSGRGLSKEELLEGVQFLINHGADVNNRVYNNYTALMFACEKIRFPELIELLIDSGARMNVRSRDGNTPFILALINNNVKAVDVLYKKKADFNYIPSGEKPFGLLASRGNVYMAKYLERYMKFDVNERDDFSMTPAMWASLNGQVHFLEFISERGVDFTLKTTKPVEITYKPKGSFFENLVVFPKGSTVATFAKQFEGNEALEWLIDRGINEGLDIQTEDKQKPLFY